MLPERFLSKLLFTDDGHWLWIASLDSHGYGQFNFKGNHVICSRFAWEHLRGPIPEGIFVLHKNSCHLPACCNVWNCLYLGTRKDNAKDAVDLGTHYRGINMSIKTHCPQGHPYDEENTYIYKNKRYCKACNRISALNYYKNKQALI